MNREYPTEKHTRVYVANGFYAWASNIFMKAYAHKSLRWTTRRFGFPLGGSATALADLGFANQEEGSSVRLFGGGWGHDLRRPTTSLAQIHEIYGLSSKLKIWIKSGGTSHEKACVRFCKTSRLDMHCWHVVLKVFSVLLRIWVISLKAFWRNWIESGVERLVKGEITVEIWLNWTEEVIRQGPGFGVSEIKRKDSFGLLKVHRFIFWA